jgi:DNA topoisomerase-1
VAGGVCPGTSAGTVAAKEQLDARSGRMRLRRTPIESPGITRRRRGSGFSYEDPAGRALQDAETLERIRALAIPPAWTDVWICPDPRGHIQATGTDAAGRRQYVYHSRWRARRDAEKFERMIAFAHALPRLRERSSADLALPGLPKAKALACAVRLLDRGFFRVGSESYVKSNGSFGLATLRKDHVKVEDDRIVFDFRSKSGKRRTQEVRDPDVAPLVGTMKRRRNGGHELLAYRERRWWRDVRSADVNGYVREAANGEFTAKDFRTWHGTVLASVFLALRSQEATSSSSRRRVVSSSVRDVAGFLGNTPAVARASYIHPRVIALYEEGITIADALRDLPIEEPTDTVFRQSVEAAVLDLLDDANVERTPRAA